MGAEITWYSDDAIRVGAIRYGAAFSSSGARHRYDGCGVTVDRGDGTAIVGPIGSEVRRNARGARLAWRLLSWALGRPPEFSRGDWTDILAAHAAAGFSRVEFERHGAWWRVDLAQRPWRMRRVG